MNKNKQMIKKKANEAMKKKKRYVLVYKIDTVVQKVITVLPVLVFIIYTAILFYLFLFKTDPIIHILDQKMMKKGFYLLSLLQGALLLQ